jgi:hypothetical protein
MELLMNAVIEYGGQLLNTEVAKMTIAFLIAARLHRKWVKKDVFEQVKNITEAINNLGVSMNKSISSQSLRIDELSTRVDNLERK